MPNLVRKRNKRTPDNVSGPGAIRGRFVLPDVVPAVGSWTLKKLSDLHRVQRGTLQQLIAGNPEREPIL